MSGYVRVRDAFDEDESVEVPTERDGTLLLSTVQAQFPGSVGLRYQGGSGLWRACRMIEGVIDPPIEGWEGIEFSVVKQGVKRAPGAPPAANSQPNQEGIAPPNSKQHCDNSHALVLKSEADKQVVPYSKSGIESKFNPELIIASVAYAATEEEIRAYFSQFGELEKFRLSQGENGKHKGFGFIKYTTLAATKKVQSMPHKIHDRRIDVSPTRESIEIINREKTNALVVAKLDSSKDLGRFGGSMGGGQFMIPDIMIANLPYIAGDAEIRMHFEGYGELDTFQLTYDNLGKSKGYGFIKYKTVAATKDCLNTTHTIHNRLLDVSPTKRAMEMLQVGYGIECMPNDNIPTRLFVGRLPYDATETDLHTIFKEYSLKSVHLPANGSKGYGFVTTTSIAEAYRIMNDSHMWKGKCLNVSCSDKRPGAPSSNPPTNPDGMDNNELNEWMLEQIQKLSQMTPEQRMQAKVDAQRQELMKSSNATAYDYGYGNRVDIGNTNQHASNPTWGNHLNHNNMQNHNNPFQRKY